MQRNRPTSIRLLGIIAVLALGCAPRIRSSTSQSLPPKLSAEEVEVFTDVHPSRGYEEVGRIDVRSEAATFGAYRDLIADVEESSSSRRRVLYGDVNDSSTSAPRASARNDSAPPAATHYAAAT